MGEETQRFDTGFRGYDKEQVDAYIANLLSEIEAHKERADTAQSRLDQISGKEEMLHATLYQAQLFADSARQEAEKHRDEMMAETNQQRAEIEANIAERRAFLEQGLQEMMDRYSAALKEIKFVFNSGIVFTEQMEGKYQRLVAKSQTEERVDDETRFALVDPIPPSAPKTNTATQKNKASAKKTVADQAADVLAKIDKAHAQPANTAQPNAPKSNDSDAEFSLYRKKVEKQSDDGEYSEEELDRFLRSLREGGDGKG
ncbi:DivIVA domain-containing protein [Chrysiogenes arsenatis]|uniref:DivIVA domain-containing protein n=1 Tax=Chrysiogenes arsenatis TaxID=309797 RepID=UPI0003FAF070|nr:DivIVA domain-containing protein [Chrysiogenes arsenatis]